MTHPGRRVPKIVQGLAHLAPGSKSQGSAAVPRWGLAQNARPEAQCSLPLTGQIPEQEIAVEVSDSQMPVITLRKLWKASSTCKGAHMLYRRL